MTVFLDISGSPESGSGVNFVQKKMKPEYLLCLAVVNQYDEDIYICILY
jgi:hypothetical protein